MSTLGQININGQFLVIVLQQFEKACVPYQWAEAKSL